MKITRTFFFDSRVRVLSGNQGMERPRAVTMLVVFAGATLVDNVSYP